MTIAQIVGYSFGMFFTGLLIGFTVKSIFNIVKSFLFTE